jgi:hypothetical protein
MCLHQFLRGVLQDTAAPAGEPELGAKLEVAREISLPIHVGTRLEDYKVFVALK